MTTIRDYVKAVMTAMQSLLDDFIIEEKDVVKMNDLISHGICARRRGENAGPTVYLDDAFERGEDIDIVARTLADIVRKADRNKPVTADGDIDLSFDAVKGRLALRLVDTEKNNAYLADKPHREIGAGLAVIAEISVGDEYGIVVTDGIAEDYDLDTLFDTALENMTALYPAKMMSLEGALLGDERNILDGDGDIDSACTLMIDGGHGFGAVTLAYKGIAERIRERFGSGYYILPSSLHEVILIKDDGATNTDDLKRMVLEANLSVVEPHDVLSDSVFYFGDDGHGLRRVA